MTVLDALTWIAAAIVGTLVLTQAIGFSHSRLVAVGQALTPWLLIIVVATVAVGAVRQHWLLLATGLGQMFGIGVVVLPALRRSPAPDVPPDARRLSVAHDNLLYTNVRRSDAALAALVATGADVLAMSEFTPHHERSLQRMCATSVYPHRFGTAATTSVGVAIWSKHPLRDLELTPMNRRPGLIATVTVDTEWAVRLVLAHPDPPDRLRGLRHWVPSLREIARLGSQAGPPTLIVGDLNAARWHPPFRAMLRSGWRDAHEALGRGLSASWPTAGPLPFPFVRLDHALTRTDLVAVEIRDVRVPGSDHLGFVVDIAHAG